ncbi:MAG: hypothetical protein C0404_06960 [Verrucomicrobia bacterium]|nr:hypothetical protein [Verrucomicrobiota bacterium]
MRSIPLAWTSVFSSLMWQAVPSWNSPLYSFPGNLQGFIDSHRRAVLAAQLAGTLAILICVPSSIAATAMLAGLWILTFGTVTLLDAAIFVAVNILFSVMDIMTVNSQVFQFTTQDAFGLPCYEFILWGFYVLHMRRVVQSFSAPAHRNLSLAIVAAMAFGIAFSAAPDSTMRLVVPAAVVGVALVLFRSQRDIAAASYLLLVGALVEYTGVWAGLWSYAEQVPGGVPPWSIPMWMGVGLFASRLFPFPARNVTALKAATATDILLVNSFNPRRRSLSDVFLDNGLAILRASLEQRGYTVEIEDRTGIGQLDSLSPGLITRPLRRLSLKLLDARERGRRAPILKFGFLAMQYILDLVHSSASSAYIRMIVRKVRNGGIPVVGIKVWYGHSFKWSKALTTSLKRECPETIVIAGGPHANLYSTDGAILRYSNFDLAVYSEGERTLDAIMECVRAADSRQKRLDLIHVRRLPNLIWRDGDRIVVNEIERPQPDTKPLPEYEGQTAGKVLIHTIVDGLGCDYNRCTFCPHKNIYRGYRKRSVTAVVDEMEMMLAQGISIFRFASGDTPRCHAAAIADEILGRGLNLRFSMFHRGTKSARFQFDTLVDEYRKLIRAGLRSVFMGLETGDDRTNQEVLGKNLCAEDVVWSIRAIQKARQLENQTCDIALSMMHPVPALAGTTWDDLYERTLAVVLDAKPDSALVTPPCSFPGTDWFARPKHYGFAFSSDFVEQMMNYEYVLYKPTDLWDAGTYSLNGKSARALLDETMRLRAAFERNSIPTDMGDETFLLLHATGEDSARFKKETLADILSCNYEYSNQLYAAANRMSKTLARSNQAVKVDSPQQRAESEIAAV